MDSSILSEIIGGIVAIVLAVIAYLEKRKVKQKDAQIASLQEEKKSSDLRLNLVDKILDIALLGKIQDAVKVIFEETKADRFLILVAINGKVNFNVVSVIYEQHKDTNYRGNAIARYRNLEIDEDYRAMLKDAEAKSCIEVNVDEMRDCLLKRIYQVEGVKHSNVRHLLRLPIDSDNDVLVYSSVATHDNEIFNVLEKTIFLTQYNSTIIPSLRHMISEF